MRVVALISGGKDSCYNAMLCVAAGHNVVALANLQPKGKEDELDSFMYQTVGHEAVELVAKAMGLPLYRGTTSGLRSGCGLQYTPHDGDEVEDLYHLLKRVQRSEDVEGVASGAVLSNYQRLRVENVCVRLGLTSIAYLWQRDQEELLTNMIDDGLNAIIIKVATIGLRQTHLGQTLQEIKPHLKQLHSCYGVHMCGEGGEYETMTLDCPLFTHTIIIDESEVIMVTDDDIAPVAYLKLHQLHLEKKNPSVQRSLPSLPTPEISVQIPHTQTSCYGGKGKVGCGDDGRVWRGRVFEGVGDDITQQTNRIFYELTDWLKQCGCEYNDVAITQLYLSSLSDYLIVNSIYQTYYQNNPPARVCVQMSVPDGVLVRLEVLVYHRKQREGVEEREERGLVAMHVQSMSCWAPANIGPYSQSMTGGVVVFTAGQIGLDPATMSLVSPPLQPSLALNHITTVLDASHTHLTSALCGICYYTTEEAGWIARMTWGKKLGSIDGCGPVVVFARVPALPRGGCVEWSFISLTCPSSQLHHQSKCKIKDVVGMVTSDIVTWCDDDDNKTLGGAWLFTITSPPITMVDICDTVSMCMEELTSVLASDLCELTQLRLFIPHYASTPPPPPRGTMMDVNSTQRCGGSHAVWRVFPVTYLVLYLLGLCISSAVLALGLIATRSRKKLSVSYRGWSDSLIVSLRRLKQLARKLVSGDDHVSKVLITVGLLCNLIYMALAFQRTYHRETRCFSSLAEVPDIAIELVISLPLIIFFFIRLLAADNPVFFWLHINTIVDVVTLPNVFIAISLGQDWLDTKALRFFWLTQFTDVISFFPFVHSQDTIEAVSVLVRLIALWMGASGVVHLLESTGDPWNDFDNKQSNSFLDYAYFIMVTMSTVGYGDYFAMTDVGRVFMTFFIITGIAFFAFALPNLVDLVVNYYHNTQWSKYDTTRVPRHVLVCGHITHTIVSDFLKDFLHNDRGDNKTHVLFMHTERPDSDLRKVLRSYYTRVQYVVGSVLKASDLAKAKIPTSDNFSECMAVFILAEKHSKDPETEDQENLLRLVSIKNTDSKIPVTVQVLLPSSKEKVKYIPRTSSDTVICLTELKFGLLAQSCLCPGLSTLIGNFFYASEELKKAKGWLELYGKGVSKELYITCFSTAFDGMSFYSAAQLCYEKMGLILLAIEDKQSEMLYITPSPSNHPTLTIKADNWEVGMIGYFIGTDQHHVDMVSVYEEGTLVIGDKGLGGIPLSAFNDGTKKRRLSTVHRGRSLSPLLVPRLTPLHLCQPQSMQACLVDSQIKQATDDHVLLCVFADNKSSALYLRNFIEPLRRSTIPEDDILPITIIANQKYLEKEWPCINNFPKVSVLPRSPLDWDALSLAGVETCRVCVILTASKKDEEKEEAALRDKEAILCSLMIHNHHNKVGSPRATPPLIITDLIEESNVQFLDIEDDDDDDGHIYSAQPYACGEAFAGSLFDSITSSTFHSPGILFFVGQLISASNCERCCTHSTIKRIPLTSIPLSTSCTNFQQLYSYMLTQHKTPVAISRLINPTPLEGGAIISAIVPITQNHRDCLNSQRYVVTAPPPDTPLLSSDYILVLEEQT